MTCLVHMRKILPPGLHELMGDYYRVEKDLSRLYVMPFTTLPRGPAQLACRRLTDVAGRGNHPLVWGKWDSILFEVDQPILLEGFGLYGEDEHTDGKLMICSWLTLRRLWANMINS